jgi:hypothetical protein
MERRSLKRLLPSLLETCVTSGPLAPRALPRFLATMSRSDSRPMPTCGYGFPHAVVRLPTRAAGSPRTLDSSVVTRPPQSPRAARCVQILVTSAPVAGFSTFGRVAAATGFTRPNQVRLRWARDFAHHDRPWSCARLPSPGRTGPFRAVSYPSTPDRSYMVNEQLTWLTPRSQLDKSGLPWCTEVNEENGSRDPAQNSTRHRPDGPAGKRAESHDTHKHGSFGVLVCFVRFRPFSRAIARPRRIGG